MSHISPKLCPVVMLAALVLLVGVSTPARSQQPPAQPAPTIVLNTYGTWRFTSVLEPVVLASGESVALKQRWLNCKTPVPAPDWMSPDFDDRFWFRGPVPLSVKSALVSRTCVRGYFTATDPAAVKGLALSVGYRGGLVVYLNGKEVHREHIAPGQPLAEGPGGQERNLSALPLPANFLRRGLNVIALDIVRAPYPEQTRDNVYEVNSSEILTARLTSDGPAGLIPNAVRPAGFQIWNADPVAMDCQLDFGDPAEPLRPVTIMGARNGSFTGKVVVGSTEPIAGLKVTPADLKSNAGSIPASSVRVRYGISWGDALLVSGRRFPSPYPTPISRLGALAEKPLEQFPVLSVPRDLHQSTFRTDPADPKPVNGAVVPLWITVHVPAALRAGTYTGSLTIQAQGVNPVQVPVELHVANWQLPDTKDFRTFVDLIQGPDNLSLEYNLSLWSDKHFDMIARSFRIIGETGSRTVYIPLVAHTNLGNEESMVRWVKNGDAYTCDFSIMDRYLDVAEKNMGKPEIVIFVIWDNYMIPPKDATEAQTRFKQRQMATHVAKTAAESMGHGPMVTLLDPASGKTELLSLPPYTEPEAKSQWKPLFDQLIERMRKRGLADTMMLGLQNDAWASSEEHVFFKDITGGLPWVIQSHDVLTDGKLQYDYSRVAYQATHWGVQYSDGGAEGRDLGTKSLRGYDRKVLVAQFDRWSRELYPNVFWLNLAESTITGSLRGNGRIGADYWKVLRDKRGERVGRSHQRYPESTWRNLFICEGVLAPGPDGPVATDQFEAFREGIQQCEARIVVERALNDETLKAKLGPDLARRCQDYLDARHMMMFLSLSDLQLFYDRPGDHYMAQWWRRCIDIGGSRWFLGSGWQLRTQQLYSLAGEVSAKLVPQ